MSIKVKLEVFEGPLDLLLHLIEKSKLNIYDIPIVEITEQYLEYLKSMEKLNMEVTSEFLVMAATLLNIKAKMLLPSHEEEEEDPREELIQKLIEYKQYKYAAGELEQMIKGPNLMVTRSAKIPEDLSFEVPLPSIDKLLKGITLKGLYDIYMRLLFNQQDKIDPIRSKFKSIPKDKFTVEEKIQFLIDELNKLKKLSFNQLTNKKSKSESITTFLALLELIKMNEVLIQQENTFGNIEIEYKGG